MGLGALAVVLERRVRIPSAFHVAFSILTLWAGCSIYWTVAHDVPGGIDYTYYRLSTYTQLFAMILLVWQFVTTEDRVESLLRAYVLGSLIPFFATVRNYLSGQMHYYQRYSLDNTEPNDLALVLALSLPMSYYLFLRSSGFRRSFYLLHMLIVLGTILLTVSRGGTLATVVALSIVFWTRRELSSGWRWGLVGVGCVGVVAAVLLTPVTTWTRLATLGSEVASGTLNSRTIIWHEGWKAFQQAPFLGVGIGAYPDALASYFGYPSTGEFTPVAHNTFYSYLVETGIIGFAIFAIMFGIVLSYAFRQRGLARPLWLTVLATWVVGVNALSWDDRKPTWMIFALVACHYAASRKRASTWSPQAWFSGAPKPAVGLASDRTHLIDWKEFVS